MQIETLSCYFYLRAGVDKEGWIPDAGVNGGGCNPVVFGAGTDELAASSKPQKSITVNIKISIVFRPTACVICKKWSSGLPHYWFALVLLMLLNGG